MAKELRRKKEKREPIVPDGPARTTDILTICGGTLRNGEGQVELSLGKKKQSLFVIRTGGRRGGTSNRGATVVTWHRRRFRRKKKKGTVGKGRGGGRVVSFFLKNHCSGRVKDRNGVSGAEFATSARAAQRPIIPHRPEGRGGRKIERTKKEEERDASPQIL